MCVKAILIRPASGNWSITELRLFRSLKMIGHRQECLCHKNKITRAGEGDSTPERAKVNAVLDLLEGISILWLYAAIRPRYGAGAKTAVIAAFAWWFIVTLGDATWCSFGFFPPRTVIPLMAGSLPALILATLAGARFYKE